MRNIKIKLISIALSFLLIISNFVEFRANADGYGEFVPTDAKTLSENCTARMMVLMEADSKTVLCDKNSKDVIPISHLAKLMTVYLVAKSIDENTLSLDTVVTVSSHANSMQGTQIWLDKGEKITVKELLFAITVGNANDACVALAEKVGGSEAEFVSVMNDTAKALGMENTHFEDSTGLSEKTVSCAYDLGVLAGEILRYEFLSEFFLTWMINVRNNQTELVNTNRLVRTYNGISGMKASYGEKSGQCLVATAKRNGMNLVSVMLDCKDNDSRFKDGKLVLDYGFSNYEILKINVPDEVMNDVKVSHGKKFYAKVGIVYGVNSVVPRGVSGTVEMKINLPEKIEAPLKKGDEIGEILLEKDGKMLTKVQVVVCENVEKIDVLTAFKRILLNLLKL